MSKVHMTGFMSKMLSKEALQFEEECSKLSQKVKKLNTEEDPMMYRMQP